jgi:hypothetical protein
VRGFFILGIADLKPTFEQLQEMASEITARTLQDYVVPARIQDHLVVGVAPESDYRVFEVYVPRSEKSDEQVVARVWMNIHTGEGVVHVVGLVRKSFSVDKANGVGWKPRVV